ncbi:snRNA-activating protein complex subunit 3-like [Styela clava]|uniref:snRNA-activating protein complex subunit 3-like n=1 Tax=Styela clava TaxID=7725 RepID=UPI00193AA840|nr:snRNA-activating protein complex subunit 3-like [Styela clava]
MSKILNEKRNVSIRVSEAMGMISPLIHIGQFKKDASQVLDEFHMNIDKKISDTPEDVAHDLNTNVETATELMEVCSPNKLECPREKNFHRWEDVKLIPTDSGLDTVKAWIKLNKTRNLEKKTIILKSKYTEYDCNLENQLSSKPAKNKDDKIKCPETVITIGVNFPRSYRTYKHTTVDYRVLGSQKLTELRDIIPCAIDQQPVGKFTDNPDHPRDIKCKDLYKAGFFFIENTFYNDHRYETQNDISKIIFDWVEANGAEMPSDCKCLNMEDYTFDDLDLCLGSPYLYMHQGNCEHVIIFKDIRLLHSDDCQSRSNYPLSISRAKFKSFICKVCNFFVATWLTRNDELSDEDPSFFCDACFRMLHYNKDGSKAADFVAYPFVNREELAY